MDPTPIALVCLDMAGTTVRDDDAVLRAFRAAMADVGVPPGSPTMVDADRVVGETMGQSKIEVFRRLLDGDEARAQRANVAFEDAFRAAVRADGVVAIDGADDLFGELRAAGVGVCLTTGFSPTTRDELLDALGWRDRVDLALSPVDAGRGRPHPDLNLTAVLRLGIDDVRAVAVAGDTTSDLWAGWRAGASIVAGVLTGAHDRATLATAPHTHLFTTVVELLPVVLATRSG